MEDTHNTPILLTQEQLDEQALRDSMMADAPGYAAGDWQDSVQQDNGTNWVSSVMTTTASRIVQRGMQEQGPLEADLKARGYSDIAAQIGSLGAYLGITPDQPNYDKAAMAAELTEGIPVDQWGDILEHNDLNAARRQRMRIRMLEDRTSRLSGQMGTGSTLAYVAGGFIDVDAPLMALSGGALAAEKVAALTYRGSKAAGLADGAAVRMAGVVQGAWGGVQSSLAVTGVEASMGEKPDLQRIVDSILTGATTGGALGILSRPTSAVTAARLRMINKNRWADVAREAHQKPEVVVDQLLDNMHLADDGQLDIDPASPSNVIQFKPREPNAPADPAFETADVVGPAPLRSAGAARIPHTPAVTSNMETITPQAHIIIQRASDWMDRTGARQMLADIENTKMGKLLFGTTGGLIGKGVSRALAATGHDLLGLYKSASNAANWFAINVFEHPAAIGTGAGTSSSAATMMDNAEARMAATVMNLHQPMQRWAKRTGQTMKVGGIRSGFHVSNAGQRAFFKKIVENMNDLRMGRPMADATDDDIMAAVEMMQKHGFEALDWMKGIREDHSVKGSWELKYDLSYVPQRTDDQTIHGLLKSGVVKMDDLVDAMSTAYQRANPHLAKDVTDILAKANIGRAWRRDADVDVSMIDLLTEDGRNFMRERLMNNGMPEAEVDSLMEKLVGKSEERGMSGFTKHRNDMDLRVTIRTTDGSALSMADIMNHDIPNMLQSYRKQVAGSGALARKGMRSRKDVDEMINAIQSEQRARGETAIETDRLKAMLSEFHAGPNYGFAFGHTNKGVLPVVSIAKQISGLSLLNRMGIPQMVDAANQISQDGLLNWVAHTRTFQRLRPALRDVDNNLREDLAVMVGPIGMDQWIFRPHAELDDIADTGGAWLKGIRKGLGSLSFIQGYTSLFNIVKSAEQQMGATIFANKIIREIRKDMLTKSKSTMARHRMDYGITEELHDQIKDMIDNGTITFAKIGGVEYVERLNPHLWSKPMQWDFGSVMVRGQNKNTMKAMAGETDVALRTDIGAVLSHLKMFPLLSIPKQFARHMRFADMQTAGMIGWGFAASYLALEVRDAMGGRDRSDRDRVIEAMGYGSMGAWMPMAWDPAMTMLGLDDYRMSKYGRNYEVSLPIVDVANRLLKVGAAVPRLIQGQKITGDQRSSLLAIPFVRTLGIGEWLLEEWNDGAKAMPRGRAKDPDTPPTTYSRPPSIGRAALKKGLALPNLPNIDTKPKVGKRPTKLRFTVGDIKAPDLSGLLTLP